MAQGDEFADCLSRASPHRKVEGCQVDLLVQTPMTAYVVEIKRKRREIDESIVGEVQKKLARIPRRKNLSLRPVLVYDGELSAQVEGAGFFDAVIPAEKLLEV